MATVRIGLVGERDDSVPAHRGIPLALADAGSALRIAVEFEWMPTDRIAGRETLAGFDGLWCVPATPYRSMEGALLAIRHARESGLPFLGTCGGFQHALIEYARNVLGWADAEHAESSPDAVRPVVSLLACALVETVETVRLFEDGALARIYGATEIAEGYRCRYGLNPQFRQALLAGPLRASADDATGEVRAVELAGHPFFLATLFQPERAALKGEAAPLVRAFVRACAA